ncbi:hypothetical protein ACO1O0_004692 [Amphichorda felina]
MAIPEDILDDDFDREVFGPLIDIPEESLVRLALRISNQILDAPSSNGRLVARIVGSYNIVHIIQLDDTKIVIRVPATGWGSLLTETAARALESQVATMRLIRKHTTAPVPEVYNLDTTTDNEIGAPYMWMSFIPGTLVSYVWFDGILTMPILASLAQHMAKFSRLLAFDKIGSVMEHEDGTNFIDPAYDWKENADGSVQVEASGPYDSIDA